MPFKHFIDETMALLTVGRIPDEVCLDRVSFLSRAEAEGRFVETLGVLNARP